MIAALSFLLDYEKIEIDEDSDASSSEDEMAQQPQAAINKEAIYKVICILLFIFFFLSEPLFCVISTT